MNETTTTEAEQIQVPAENQEPEVKTKKKKAGKPVSPKTATAPKPPKVKAEKKTAKGKSDAKDDAPKPKRAIQEGKTLADVFGSYLRSMEDDGCSETTISSYRFELKKAGEHLGEDTLISDLTSIRVRNYLDSDGVRKKKSGKLKNQLTIDKSRRALTQALEHAESVGMVDAAPIPEETVTA